MYYFVPEIPRVRRRPDGSPCFSFLKYRTNTDNGGGFLDLQTELAGPGDALVDRLREDSGGRTPEVRAPQFVDGTVQLALPGQAAISSRPSLMDGCLAGFEATLTADMATLLWEQAGQTPSPLAVAYDLTFLARLPEGRARLWSAGGRSGVELLDAPGEPGASLEEFRRQLAEWAARDLGADGREYDIVLTAGAVITSRAGPRGNLPLPAEGLHEYDLTEPIFRTLRVETQCDADFARGDIHSVRLRLRCGSFRHEALFTDSASVDAVETVLPPGGEPVYTYDAVVQFPGTAATATLPEATSRGRYLLLRVPAAGRLRVEIDGTAVDWGLTESVEAGVRYDGEEDAVVLREDRRRAVSERPVHALIDHPWDHRVRYNLRDGRRIEKPWAPGASDRLILTGPYDRFLAVRLRAPGGFGTATAHIVQCEHTGVDGRVTRETLVLRPGAETASWTAGLLPGEPPGFRYKVASTYATGEQRSGEWIEASGSQTVEVGDMPEAVLTVTVADDPIDYSVVKLIVVRLTGPGAGAALTFSPAQRGARTWTAPVPPGEPAAYTWTATYYLADGTRRTVPESTSDKRTLVLRLPPA
ncbi:hypothetical protein DQ384_19755 [Sphaerisporangium album]|uniref:Uncharacterized protein n=1 Tax=Sphaerisporangium album TaxID=509200 RepID=A0A367FHF6_9ACTN|nr:hypothetical protein [Sphaerisporangium album]RCG29803.1 hypothetical protein DQ384_19755 [Sphaerisporangium album]